jgi:hypothetical protein
MVLTYPAEGKVNSLLWNIDYIIPFLQRYNPRCTKYDENGDAVVEACCAPILYDPFEQMGGMMRAAMRLHWKYVAKCVNQKIAQFVNKNWFSHLLAYEKGDTQNVCFIFFDVVLWCFNIC